MKKQTTKYEPINFAGYQGVVASSYIQKVISYLPKLDFQKCVSDRADRKVFHAQDIFFKQFPRRGREYLLRTQARKEFCFYQQLRALKISTPLPLGYLEGNNESLFFALTRGSDCEYCLKQLIEEKAPSKIFSFLQSFALFINDLLDKGVHHGDLKLANILYDNRFYLIDLTGTHFYSSFNERRKVQSCAQILCSLSFLLSPDYLNHFLSLLIPEENLLFNKIWKKMLWKRRRRIHKKARRLISCQKEVIKKEINGVVCRFYREYELEVEHWKKLIGASCLVKKSPKRELFCFNNIYGIKRVINRSKNRCVRFFRKNQAERYWYNVHALGYYNISVPKPCALIQTKEASILILEWLPGCTLYDYILNQWSVLSEAKRSLCVQRFAAFIAKLHFEEGIYHQDLTVENILIQKQGNEFKFSLLDLDRVKYYLSQVPFERRIKNLSQIVVYLVDKIRLKDGLRFLKAYSSFESHPMDLNSTYRELIEQVKQRKPRQEEHVVSDNRYKVKKIGNHLLKFQ